MDKSFDQIHLDIDAAYYNTLDIHSFALMLKDPSSCYKFYWLEAIVNLISKGITETTFSDIIDEMICNAWYSVREFHIHLSGLGMDGDVKDGLERAVLKLAELSDLSSNVSKVEIKNAIVKHDKELREAKVQLTKMVPYRALAGFFASAGWKVNLDSIGEVCAASANFSQNVTVLPYEFGKSRSIDREIRFHPKWMHMIQDYTVEILGWIQHEKVKWLQNNNPEVPGLVYKLLPMDEKTRKLEKVRELWEGVMSYREICDVFTGNRIQSKRYDIDHFIPWSFVMNDELWNLMPMDSSLNSVKSNKLPQWDPFYRRFADNQYLLYELIHEKPGIHKLYEQCWRDNLHSIWAGQELYRPGNSKETFEKILNKNMRPVYDSALRQGYEVWRV